MSESKQNQQAVNINTTISGIGNAYGDHAQTNVSINQTQLPPLPVNLRSLVQALIEHYGQDLFGGRDAELATLDPFLADPTQPYGLLVAPTGLGKTALLMRWIARLQGQQPHWQIIFAPVSIRFETASEEVTLGILAHSLAEIHHDLEQFRQYDKTPKNLRALVSDYLRRPLPDGTQLLLVLDGIDEATGWEIGTLCAVAPQAGLKIVVAARQRANMLRDDWQHHLGWGNSSVSQLDLNQLDRSAVEVLLNQSIPAHASDPNFVGQFWRVTEGDPLTCNLLLKALTSGKISPDSLTQRPPGLEAFLKDWVRKLDKRQQTSPIIRELLKLCAAAYGPLTSDDLQALAPQLFEEQSQIVTAVQDDEVARFIITLGEHTYVFSHQRLREVFLEQIYPPKDRAKLQQRMIDYGATWYADRSQPLPDYLRQFWIAHLRTAGDWVRIQEVLTEIVPSSDGKHYQQPWQTARFAAEGSDTGYLADLDLLWSWGEQNNNLALMFRCALIASSLRSRSGNLSPELLVQLVQVGTPEGKWSPAAALEQIAHMPNPKKQAACLEALVKADIILPWQRALEIVRTISDKYYRTQALTCLVPQLPSDQQQTILDEALQTGSTIDNVYWKAQAHIALVTILPPDQRHKVITDILQTTHTIPNKNDYAKVLSALAPLLSTNQQQPILAEALLNALIITPKGWSSEAINAVTDLLSPSKHKSILIEAFHVAQAISDEFIRGWALTTLAPLLPANFFDEALQAVRTINDKRWDGIALINLARLMPPDQRQIILEDVFHSAYALSDENRRTQLLTELVHLMPPDQRQIILEDVFHSVYAICDKKDHIQALIRLVPLLSNDQRQVVLTDALRAVRTVFDQRFRVQIFTVLAPLIVPDQQHKVLAEALQFVRFINDEISRVLALTAFSPLLLIDHQDKVIAEALQTAHVIYDEGDRALAFNTLVPLLTPTQQKMVLTKSLNTSRAISERWRQVEALIALVLFYPTINNI